jgi:hypothetical protein
MSAILFPAFRFGESVQGLGNDGIDGIDGIDGNDLDLFNLGGILLYI